MACQDDNPSTFFIKKEVFMRKYKVNEDYFKLIDTEEKAYWLGFLYADGCVTQATKYSKRLQVNLSIKDINHLEILRKT